MRMEVFNQLTPPQEAHPMERLLDVLGNTVQFFYTCWDRIVLNGYLERLQRPENLIHFFHDVVGIQAIEPAVLEQRTTAYKAWMRRITDELGIPVVTAPHGVKKEELVEPYYRRLKDGQGVACVLTSMEQGRTFVSYVPRWKVPSGDANYRFIKACRKQFLHYYWYVLDPVMGPMSVRVASYFPFNVTCYLNGHSFVAQELRRDGVRFHKADNAFLAVSDVCTAASGRRSHAHRPAAPYRRRTHPGCSLSSGLSRPAARAERPTARHGARGP